MKLINQYGVITDYKHCYYGVRTHLTMTFYEEYLNISKKYNFVSQYLYY